jgi:hypothetical protein
MVSSNSQSVTVSPYAFIAGQPVPLSVFITVDMSDAASLTLTAQKIGESAVVTGSFSLVAGHTVPHVVFSPDGTSVTIHHSVPATLPYLQFKTTDDGDHTITATASMPFLERVYQRRIEAGTGDALVVQSIASSGQYTAAQMTSDATTTAWFTRHDNDNHSDHFQWQSDTAIASAANAATSHVLVSNVTYNDKDNCILSIGGNTSGVASVGLVLYPNGVYASMATTSRAVGGYGDGSMSVEVAAEGNGNLYIAGAVTSDSDYAYILREGDPAVATTGKVTVLDLGETRTYTGLSVAHDESHLVATHSNAGDVVCTPYYNAAEGLSGWTAGTALTVSATVADGGLTAGPVLVSEKECSTQALLTSDMCLFVVTKHGSTYTLRRSYDNSNAFAAYTFEEVDVASLIAPFGNVFTNSEFTSNPDDDMVFVPSGQLVRGDKDLDGGEIFIGGHFRWERKVNPEMDDNNVDADFLEIPAVCRIRDCTASDVEDMQVAYFIAPDAFRSGRPSRRFNLLAYNPDESHKTLWGVTGATATTTGVLGEYYFMSHEDFANVTSSAKVSAAKEAGDLGISALWALLIGIASGLALAGIVALIMYMIRKNRGA